MASSSTLYLARGVSSTKDDVHNAVAELGDDGLFPGSFCKITPDELSGSDEYCLIMHADGAGTKAALAYIYWKETGDSTVFRGLAQDSLVMNTDDLLCVGCVDSPLLLSNTIGRNRNVIPAEVVKELIVANQRLAVQLRPLGLDLRLAGGETADIGDLVRTLVVDSTLSARMKRKHVITNNEIRAGDIIIGLSSTGKTTYEEKWNSGIGSNGLTSARHELLHSDYQTKYPESCDPSLPSEMVYTGPYKLDDPLDGTPLTIGEALLSPTRTYFPIFKELLKDETTRKLVHGIVHCTGGGQTKCLRFGKGLKFVKDNLFPCPAIFAAILRKQQNADSTAADCTDRLREMYSVFSMGHRMELFGPPQLFEFVAAICAKFSLDCRQVGRVEASTAPDGANELLIKSDLGTFHFVQQI